jgi:hypothetical protein
VDNLITLCEVCHPSSNDFVDLSLYKLIGLEPYAVDVERREKYREGMLRYTQIARQCFKDEYPFLKFDEYISDEGEA